MEEEEEELNKYDDCSPSQDTEDFLNDSDDYSDCSTLKPNSSQISVVAEHLSSCSSIEKLEPPCQFTWDDIARINEVHDRESGGCLNNRTYGDLSEQLQQEINEYPFSTFIENNVTRYKKTLFNRKVPTEMVWTDISIPTPLLEYERNDRCKNIPKQAILAFKNVQQAMGDRKSRQPKYKHVQYLIRRGLDFSFLRDEIFLQICMQITMHPNEEGLLEGWALLAELVNSFPPSRKFECYLKNFLMSKFDHTTELEQAIGVSTFARYSLKTLLKTCETGAKVRVPKEEELLRTRHLVFNVPLFGSTIEDSIATNPSFPVPRIVTVLCEAILMHGGLEVEGIFRVPGDIELVYALKLQFEKGDMTFDYSMMCEDPHTAGSLLKLWLRSLEEPLIPSDLYFQAIEDRGDTDNVSALIENLPRGNKIVVYFIIDFLRHMSLGVSMTKMDLNNLAMVFAPCFLRCPSSDPIIILQNARHEIDFMLMVLSDLYIPVEFGCPNK